MKLKIGLLIFLIAFATKTTVTFAQDNQIILSSNPNGAYVELIGEYTIRGLTPLQIPYKLEGIYMIKASMYGYENWSTIRDLSSVKGSLSFNLNAKSRFKAGLRSFLFPGWGQFYSDRKLQGTLLGGLGLASAIVTIDRISKYNKLVDDYDYLLDRYKITNLSYEERRDIREKISAKQNEADEAYEERQKWLYISASVWIYNIFDAIFFFKFDKMRSVHEIFPTVSATAVGEQTLINLKWNF